VLLGGEGMSFVVGDGWEHPPPPAGFRQVDPAIWEDLEVDLSTDDWPFLYMPERRYPTTYLAMILALLVVSFLLVRGLGLGGKGTFSPPCFFLGAGFMLVETKAVTELALAYGSTWWVVGLAIGAILLMAFLANLVVMRWGAPRARISYGFLFAALLAGLTLPGLVLAALPEQVAGLALTGLLTLPLFFSGFAFSAELARSRSVASAFSSNLLGAMLGGFLEYNSMFLGFNALYVLALALYALAFFSTTALSKAA
jgi:hypothetical protein